MNFANSSNPNPRGLQPSDADMGVTKVALAGATGNLGIPVLEALLSAGHCVTVLSRVGGNAGKLAKYANLEIREVDFSKAESIRPALEGVTVVVSCLATLAIGSQNALIDAAFDLGVKRFIPAEFGMDSHNLLCAKLPVCEPKVATQKYLTQKSVQRSDFTWSGIANGLFLDWGLQAGFIVNPALCTATLFNGGNVPFSATTLADVGKAVVGVIENQGLTENRLLYIQSALVTQNQLIQYAKDKNGRVWSVDHEETGQVLKKSFVKLGNGDDQAAMDGFCKVAMWDSKHGGNFSDHLDNKLLGVPSLDQIGVRAIVEAALVE